MNMAINAHINEATSRLTLASLVSVSLLMLTEWIVVLLLSVFGCRRQGGTAVHIDRADNGYL